MELNHAIHTRQSIARVKPDSVPQFLIERLLESAVQAPNHHRNRPWRFIVLTGAARERLGAVLETSLKERNPDAPTSALEKERSRPLRAPVIIAVGVDKPDGPKIVEMDNICAAAAAVQNLLLTAHSLGLGAIWRSGEAVRDVEVKAFLGLQPDQHLIAMIYIGYPEVIPEAVERPSFQDRTTWITD